MRRVHGARCQGLGRRELQLCRRQRADERQALAERAAGVEVGGEGDRRACVDERPGRGHRAPEEQRARRQEHRDHVAPRELADPVRARRLEVVDGARCELDRQPDRTLLGELVAVDAHCEARRRTGVEVAPRLRDVEGAAFEEDVGSLRELGCIRQDLGHHEVDVRVRVGELGRHRVGAQPRRDTPGVADRAQ